MSHCSWFFYAFDLEKVAMQQCPHCHSEHVQLLKQTEQRQHSPLSRLSTFSPMTLATVAMQMSKRMHIHPLFGGCIGLVVGGMFLLYVEYQSEITVLHYQCEQCQQHFEIRQVD
ncbi:hypothetical protein L289_0365 [Acinetobacter gerneri DSM 14967 = CIP 107464 = MTCC 9824]|nr:hypothetical protein L289_0365 [Acinetobacter gerneri DSM 14967 = CIP 107464 = MTCC 9824]